MKIISDNVLGEIGQIGGIELWVIVGLMKERAVCKG